MQVQLRQHLVSNVK